MRRAVAIAALTAASLLAGTGGLPEGSADPRLGHSTTSASRDANRKVEDTWRWRECRMNSLYVAPWTAREERLTSECALAKWSVEGGYGKFYAVAACESGWNRFASNDGRYLGLFQHAAPYWRTRVHNMRPVHWSLAPHWSNSRTQIVVTARIVHQSGWGMWSCA